MKRSVIAIIVGLIIAAGNVVPAMGQGATTPIKVAYDDTTNELTPVWSADGKAVLYTKQMYPADRQYKTQLFEVTLDHPLEPQLIMEIKGLVYGVTWSPDRQRIAYLIDKQVFVRNRTGEQVFEAKGELALWSPDGTQLLVWTPLSLEVVNLNGEVGIGLYYTEPANTMHWSGGAWSPDGKQIAVIIAGDVVVFDVQAKTNVNLTHSDGDEAQPAWSPDGTWIAFSSWASYDGILPPLEVSAAPIYIIRPDGSGLTRVSGTRDYDSCPVWSPDGHSIAFTRGGDPEITTLFMVNVDTLAMSWLDRPDGRIVSCATWSPDGEYLLTQGTLLEWERGVSVYVVPHTAFKSDAADSALINRMAFISVLEPSAVGESVRNSPGYDNALIDKLYDGNLFQIIGTGQESNGDTWLQIRYKGDGVGWIHVGDLMFAARNLDPNVFCYDARPREVIGALREVARKRDGGQLARLIGGAGLFVAFGGKTVHLSYLEVEDFFNDYAVRDWGRDANSGRAITASLADEVAATLERDLTPDNVSIMCGDNQDSLSERRQLYGLNIGSYKIINFYSVMRPGTPGNELDWGAWGIAFSYQDGRPVVLGLTHYVWTP
ncbi:MAG: PD40 domain-containing protein [Anaerolineae bacterium]|nr:PD40 domain-containing protein [Anaerolineae bacterium]